MLVWSKQISYIALQLSFRKNDMNQKIFLETIAEVLDHDGILVLGQDLDSIDEWDSLGILSVMGFLHDLKLKIDTEKMLELKKISDLVDLVSAVLDD